MNPHHFSASQWGVYCVHGTGMPSFRDILISFLCTSGHLESHSVPGPGAALLSVPFLVPQNPDWGCLC